MRKDIYKISLATILAFSATTYLTSVDAGDKNVENLPIDQNTLIDPEVPDNNINLRKSADGYGINEEVVKKIIAESCMLPVKDKAAEYDNGLQYLSPIMQGSRPLKDVKTGNFHHHLGWDIAAPFGVSVTNSCDGEFVWSGRVPYGDKSLGNVVVIKYNYFEDGILKTIYSRYAHLSDTNILGNMMPGDFVPKGKEIGEVSASGGWHAPHLHWDALTEEAWNAILGSQTINNNVAKMAGYYAEAEKWEEGRVKRDFVDIKKWMESRISSSNK
jgi:murein DD-endopeptidase MepM/ murein hydrolase activator NlpD